MFGCPKSPRGDFEQGSTVNISECIQSAGVEYV